MALVVIREIEGTRQLLLDTPAKLPEQGIEAPAKLRAVRTMYPGSSTPLTQVMGTEEEPITLKGVWRDDLLAMTGGAMELVQIARSLLLGQLPCELTWITDEGEAALTRRGLVTGFTPTFSRTNVIRWSLTFQCDEADESSVIATPAVPLVQPFDLLFALRQAAEVAAEVAGAAIAVNNVIRAVA